MEVTASNSVLTKWKANILSEKCIPVQVFHHLEVVNDWQSREPWNIYDVMLQKYKCMLLKNALKKQIFLQ